jgi:hypothetical protein
MLQNWSEELITCPPAAKPGSASTNDDEPSGKPAPGGTLENGTRNGTLPSDVCEKPVLLLPRKNPSASSPKRRSDSSQ